MQLSDYAQDRLTRSLVRLPYTDFRKWMDSMDESMPLLHTEAERFFFTHAGFSYDPYTETEVEGRARCARELAQAEMRLKEGPYYIQVEADTEPWDGDVPWDGPVWFVRLWSVKDTVEGELFGTLGGVACEDGDPYLRVVAAELALQWIPVAQES